MQQRTKFRKDLSNRCRDIAIFEIFKMAAAAILNSQKKIRNFNGLSTVGANTRHRAKFSTKSVKWLHTYGDLTVFKMAAVGHLGFVKFEIFNGQSG